MCGGQALSRGGLMYLQAGTYLTNPILELSLAPPPPPPHHPSSFCKQDVWLQDRQLTRVLRLLPDDSAAARRFTLYDIRPSGAVCHAASKQRDRQKVPLRFVLSLSPPSFLFFPCSLFQLDRRICSYRRSEEKPEHTLFFVGAASTGGGPTPFSPAASRDTE